MKFALLATLTLMSSLAFARMDDAMEVVKRMVPTATATVTGLRCVSGNAGESVVLTEGAPMITLWGSRYPSRKPNLVIEAQACDQLKAQIGAALDAGTAVRINVFLNPDRVSQILNVVSIESTSTTTGR